jgi:hypothetical protein
MADAPGSMTFFRGEDQEVYRLESAILSATHRQEGFELIFYVRAEQGTVGPRVQPNAEVSVFLKQFNPATLAGCRFEVPTSYDEELEDHVSCIYYHEHQDFDEIVVEVLAQRGTQFHIRWSGVTNDVDRYDGSAPENRVVIEGMFEYQGVEEE